jgi:hypothetical protein
VDSESARKSSHRSHEGVGARSVERAAVPSPARAAIFTSHKIELSAKKPLARAIGRDIAVDFCFQNRKNRKDGIAPWVDPER